MAFDPTTAGSQLEQHVTQRGIDPANPAETRRFPNTPPGLIVPRWQYEAFRRWFVSPEDADGVDVFVGRPLRAPGT
jgi:hypothetical protein